MKTWKWGYWRMNGLNGYIFTDYPGEPVSRSMTLDEADYGDISKELPVSIISSELDEWDCLPTVKVDTSDHAAFIAAACNEKRERDEARAAHEAEVRRLAESGMNFRQVENEILRRRNEEVNKLLCESWEKEQEELKNRERAAREPIMQELSDLGQEMDRGLKANNPPAAPPSLHLSR